MIPVNNSAATTGCSNTSSSCIIWQGPNITCINLCDGDSINEVIGKIGEKLCALPSQCADAADIDVSGLTFGCLVDEGQSNPTNILGVIQLLITEVCGIVPGSTTTTLPTVNLPSCLYYTPQGGEEVTSLPLDQYASLLATEICSLRTRVTTNENDIASILTRVITLENCVLPCPTTSTPSDVDVVSSCILQGQTVALSTLVLDLETRFCSLETAVGNSALINNAISRQLGCITGDTERLSTSGTYGSDANWIANPTTLAHTVQNIWTVVCDMHAAIKDIQLNCCPGSCDAVTYDYSTQLVKDAQDRPTSIRFYFTGSSIPGTYSDCAGLSTITVTDSTGATATQTFSAMSEQSNALGLSFPLGSLFLYGGFTSLVEFCTTDGQNVCQAPITKTTASSLPCPLNFSAATVSNTEVSISFENYLPAGAVYVIQAKNTVTSAINGTTTITIASQTNPITHTFTGLTNNTNYEIIMTITFGGETIVCGLPEYVGTLNCLSYTITENASPFVDVATYNYYDCSGTALTGSLEEGASVTICSTIAPQIPNGSAEVVLNSGTPCP